MCTAILKETISHYMKHNSEVYVCLLDAFKAFDRVKCGKIIQLLLDRKLPALIIRLILDGYARQRIYVQWNGVLSDPIITNNGVKQQVSYLLFYLAFIWMSF